MNYRHLIKIREKILLRKKNKDKLTGVYNRDYFQKYTSKKLNGTIIRVRVEGINFISLNYGVEKGEMLFSSIARRLNQICNFNEMLLSRTSRYDFTVYASVLDSKSISQFIENTMTMLINSIEEIYKIYINFNMAAVIYEKENLDIHDATNKLDVCMTNLLKKGSTFEIYNDKYDDCISIKSIEKGIKNGEIKVYYQPKVNLKNGKVAGVEALVRWFSEEHGYIPPDKIIEFCEECGYINILGKWILENACRDIKYLNETMNTNIDLSVNISPHQLDKENFTVDLVQSLKKIKFKFDLLKLEITESENIEGIIKINEIINEIKRTGIKISIDDFGKGFNSINYIKNYNVDEIKLDKSLVEYMNINPMFIESLINMIHTTKAKVVAEGVETELEYRKLKNTGCDLVQGYFCYKPMSLYELIDAVGEEKYMSNKELNMI